MAVRMRVSVSGMPGVRRALSKLKPPGSDAAVSRALRRSGKLVNEITRTQFLSGHPLKVVDDDLRTSILTAPVKRSQFVEIGSSLPQADPLEFGWPGHNLRAYHFLEGAVKRTEPQLPRIFIEEIEREIAGVARR